jgi:hypothetical protein
VRHAGGGAAPTTGPVYFGVSGPVTGPNAEYGRLWKQGFDLALTKINAAGGINGHPVALKWEDSQSDPKQTVPIAQKFVDDREIIADLGDFSSPASMTAANRGGSSGHPGRGHGRHRARAQFRLDGSLGACGERGRHVFHGLPLHSGSAAGLPQMIQSRPQFGYRGRTAHPFAGRREVQNDLHVVGPVRQHIPILFQGNPSGQHSFKPCGVCSRQRGRSL